MNRRLTPRTGLLFLSQGLALSLISLGTARCSSSSGGTNPGTETSGSAASTGTGGSGAASGASSGGSSGAASGATSGGSSGATSGGSSGASSGESSGASSGASSGEPSDAGEMDVVLTPVPDGGCTPIAQSYVATLVTVPVSWPAATTDGIMISNAGTGDVQIVLLTTETTPTGAGTQTFTGTSRTCATTLPAIQLNSQATGLISGFPKGDKGFLEISLPDVALWDKITKVSNVMGSNTGWNPGSTTTTNASVAAFGFSPSSSYNMAATAWPAACKTNCTPNGSFMASDIADDDGDMNPGITAVAVSMITGTNDYLLPPTALGSTVSADKIYTVSRTELSVTTTRLDCMNGSGTATVSLFDNHVIGCHLSGDAGACDSAQTSFLDSNRVVYKLTGGATVKTKQITSTTTPSCADARTAVGFTG